MVEKPTVLLQNFYHPGFDILDPLWSLIQVQNLKQFVNLFVEKTVGSFDEQVPKNVHLLSTGKLATVHTAY